MSKSDKSTYVTDPGFRDANENHCRGNKGRMHCVVYSIQDGGTMSAVNPGLLPADNYGTGQIF